ncbi:glycosyltransferase [Gammaproteobacteria bacterium]|jgi:glycosyltransferase involved in cell wall biosynthesis|nr:glycosyltransferase [Gammaproteobacteria bacterium]MDA9268504.1 glycosyltransferase [Gammaproteobacteria bacterium]MDA9292669.1 glycosyltransferase [Gammaproteobacteria bacterium]MDB4000528.1 glycosyltransferase [Gammaproteobacteria bacterium]MDB4094602.1 glycosyltransferase [Gammaproteobacteria bacterium]|tara:strand:+ start:357 stop:1484 length:1128 start_codon:yes stop_codon:yes gene_type:complete
MKPKVVHIISDLGSGGAERSLFKLAESNLANTYDFSVICLQGEGMYSQKLRRQGINVIALNLNYFNFLFKLFPLASYLYKVRPQIIQGWMYHGNIAALIGKYMLFAKPKLVWNIRHSLHSIKYEKKTTQAIIYINKAFSQAANLIIYNSSNSLAQHNKYGFAKSLTSVIENGFDETIELNIMARNELRERHKFTESTVVIGHVARFHPMKGHEVFIKAALTILEINPCVEILMIGRNIDWNNADLIKQIPKDYHHRFTFLGEVDNAAQFMNAMDIFALSSLWGEGFPNVLGEAMLLKIPCIANNIGGCDEIMGDTGILIDMPCSIDKWRAHLTDCISMSSEERSTFGKRGRDRVITSFSMDRTQSMYDQVYKQFA